MSQDFKVTISPESDRAKNWMEAFGTLTMPVVSPISQKAVTPRAPAGEYCYMLDLDELTPEQRKGLVNNISVRFGIPPEEVDAELYHGVPIPTDECSLTIYNPHKWVDPADLTFNCER